MTAEQQRELIDSLLSLDEPYDILLIDTAAGLTPEIVAYAEAADETLIVTTVEPTAIMDAYAMVKVISASCPSAAVQIVLNHTRTPREGEEAAVKLQSAVRHFLAREIGFLGSIPDDAQVERAVREQRPVLRLAPHSAASVSLRAIAQRLIHDSLRAAVKGMALA
jgi:flagellar biosynthesis protein FlhG